MSSTTATSERLIRDELWSNELKEILRDELDAQRWVHWMTEFPDGDTFTIPSIGDATTMDVVENQAISYESLDNGEWQFVIDEYIGSAHYITNKNLQDSFYGQQVLSGFIPKERRAIMEKVETDVLKAAGPNASQGGQTASASNEVNNYDHRFWGTGGSDTMGVEDFAYSKLALKKANVPLSNLIAIVDPNVAYTLETTANIASISNNPQWEGIVTTGLTTGMRFIRNIYGFDVYESNYLDSGFAETISTSNHHSGNTGGSNGIQNLLFSADSSVLPIRGAVRQDPKVDSEYNKDFQREEYVTTMRYGVKLYRPENMICVFSDSTAL